ncbi:elongation factor P [Longimicrobium sp.]|uniref:elongation factor P n=1 Tax=Longimicrobium sp. TaxID=2029185 RepID=UPI002E335EA1|nr:elongation factor P [Longimicrobium sp.]HEX6038110.1 elongation factor P [Longimicrobium sp.]
MATTADFRNGMTINIDGVLWTLLWFQHHKPGKGNTVVRSKMRNVLTGAVLEKTWRAGERIEEVRLEHRPMTYSYHDGHLYHFMDTQSYEDVALTAETIGEDQLKYLKDNMEVDGLLHGEKVISVELPFFVTLAISQTDPGVRGDTATGGTKPATLETGAVVQVPLFLNEGDVIRVDRREDKYIERAK